MGEEQTSESVRAHPRAQLIRTGEEDATLGAAVASHFLPIW